ncbi:hypothetical protein NHX12_020474 [Muraenolepis orangiensis]|uniref:Piwi-like protein 1 n=1 Tax=Muraenolepis orangiensis TaxID=630683 RepID=A0A9Q0EVB6_9TELE|nr:hypothetical protein NHX12_020474 [Muraenolepis orangiensis]
MAVSRCNVLKSARVTPEQAPASGCSQAPPLMVVTSYNVLKSARDTPGQAPASGCSVVSGRNVLKSARVTPEQAPASGCSQAPRPMVVTSYNVLKSVRVPPGQAPMVVTSYNVSQGNPRTGPCIGCSQVPSPMVVSGRNMLKSARVTPTEAPTCGCLQAAMVVTSYNVSQGNPRTGPCIGCSQVPSPMVVSGHNMLKSARISTGFHQVKLGDRGGRRRDFNDAGIDTRQAMEHVKAPKSGRSMWAGTSGSAIQLKANFFSIITRPQWVLYQYHVDYQPPMESRGLRAALLYPHDKVLGSARSFDGALILPIKYNNRTYRVDEIAWDHTPNYTFQRGETEVTFKEYVKRQYALEVTDNNQVLLVSHVKKMGPAMLIPEFCYLTGLTDKMQSDFTIMEDPEQRELRLNTLVNNIQKNEQAQMELSTWGLNSDKQLLSVTGRVLPVERLIQGSRRYYPNRADWSREMRGLPLISAPPLDNWLLFYTRRNAGDVQHLLESLHKVSGPLGIRMQKAVMVEYVDTQESLLRALQHNAGPQTQMVVVVLSSDRQDKYDRVKKYLCVDCPTPSRCVRGYTLSRVQQLMTVATKIALQMVCKMGGELWSVEIPLKQLMISQPGHVTLVLKVCASRQRTRDYGLKMALVGALKDYLKFNNSLPSRIMVYRDGVGDGMLQSVVNYEVPQIMESIKSLGEDYMPKLTVVVVKKRVSSRFFAHMDRKVANPPPGTVIDTDATRPEW